MRLDGATSWSRRRWTGRISEPSRVRISEPFDRARDSSSPRGADPRGRGSGGPSRALASRRAVSPAVRLRRWWPAVLVALAGLVARRVGVRQGCRCGPLVPSGCRPASRAEWRADADGARSPLPRAESTRHQWREGLARRFAEAATKAAPACRTGSVPRDGRRIDQRVRPPRRIVVMLDGRGVRGDEDGVLAYLATSWATWRTGIRPSDASVGRVGMLAGCCG